MDLIAALVTTVASQPMHYSGVNPIAKTESDRKSAGRAELAYRLRQQSLLVEFARVALRNRDFQVILQRATELCSAGLGTDFAKVLEYLPEDKRLLVRAGVGWKPGTINVVTLAADMSSPAGYAYQTGETVICNDLTFETRFRTPQLLADHGIRRAINVLVKWGDDGNAPFGVLEADSPGGGQFDSADGHFLAGFASLLGIAIERQQADAKLQAAVDHQAMLTREMSHRVKNSLASVTSLLRLQARGMHSEDVKSALLDAASRVATVAEVHDHLWRSAKIGFVELSDFVRELCGKLQETALENTVLSESEQFTLAADTAIPLGLLINELVTNAIKHAYPGASGQIRVSASKHAGAVHVEVSDRGIGLPAAFDIDHQRKSMGLRVIKALVQQLGGQLKITANAPSGALFLIVVPVAAT